MALAFLRHNNIPRPSRQQLDRNWQQIESEGTIKVTTEFVYAILYQLKQHGYKGSCEYGRRKAVELDLWYPELPDQVEVEDEDILEIIQVLGYLSNAYHDYIDIFVAYLIWHNITDEEVNQERAMGITFFSVITMEVVFREIAKGNPVYRRLE